MEITTQAPEKEIHTKDTALFFQKNESERNKQIAFLRYYSEEIQDDTQQHQNSLRR